MTKFTFGILQGERALHPVSHSGSAQYLSIKWVLLLLLQTHNIEELGYNRRLHCPNWFFLPSHFHLCHCPKCNFKSQVTAIHFPSYSTSLPKLQHLTQEANQCAVESTIASVRSFTILVNDGRSNSVMVIIHCRNEELPLAGIRYLPSPLICAIVDFILVAHELHTLLLVIAFLSRCAIFIRWFMNGSVDFVVMLQFINFLQINCWWKSL